MTLCTTRFLILSTVLFASFTSCKPKTAKTSPPVEVSVIKAQQTDVPIYQEYVGQTYGLSDVDIRARVEGWVTGVHFKEGTKVKKGTLLYTIDDIQYQTRVDQAAGNLASAKTEVARAQSQLNRVKPLADMNALSKQDLDNAVAEFNAAKARQQVTEAALQNAKIELGYAKVYAPIDGIIGISNVRVGDYVSRTSSNILSTVSQTGTVRVRFQITETEYLRFAREFKKINERMREVSLILPDNSVFNEKGHVDFANRQIDPQTGSITLEASFDNQSGLLRPGLYVKVQLLTQSFSNAIVVPQRAVTQLQNLYQVFIVDNTNTLKVKVIEPGPRVGDMWIITKGLTPGERVALIGTMALTDKSKVTPVETKWTPAAKLE
ncbi:efflux RND transporter periplasmic adaptor subunit [Solitalea canadensis]|uniref:RND family efflux transporter, MFP subunit n=1 Tax=Solitalea canadensis (strain ATCC 29591 / DSM 3403 / JCM 21819 / LMG 8368 / NBRC 15130 / NCIMB 12057 / USAM 9D) TaxID=929556 RepID=H8KLP2_SOLCM|nr:efflux RND transporter periplasmic adaptor subunit [Solitalea canadensis]AFD09196.1 RND family efflux transporter, MFP subunit [Solitalea canadensis DSM 3403]